MGQRLSAAVPFGTHPVSRKEKCQKNLTGGALATLYKGQGFGCIV
jgi:hypothetical protein